MRALARRIGVSPGAPFRHFQSRTALLTAVAEEAQDRLMEAVKQTLKLASEDDPLNKFRAIGEGFLRWAFANPTHFQVISTRAVIDYDSPGLRQRNNELQQTMMHLMQSAADQGYLRPGDVAQYVLGARALAYGLARMRIDGQFDTWGVDAEQALCESMKVLDQFIKTIRA
ncbi:TetR/AcrR family transcriptional regulator [Rhodoferax sp. GW822-FHT02A01]|uniref:TetR/AcrR family transcriptional regulator n=1 Tax=Rhodoferax sp. GW822-FHT02A01 TaxID=3141537 RepID=UPI00315C5272